MADEGYILDAALLRELRNVIEWKRNFRVTGAKFFRNDDRGCAITIDPPGATIGGSSPPKLIAVKVSQVGGSNGTKLLAPTYTYDLKFFTSTKAGTATDGTTIGTAQTPMIARPVGAVTAATYGLAIPASDGGYALFQVFEIPGAVACS